ncbi:MerR family transcriptional regulator [Streptomyces sp. NPDC051561]|uniref:MerR family transcriptional regulator n=1 Tax=Streptomyces sp. NPDC051561 TaxID=3365658 RepID=UPI00379E4333
MNGNPEGSRGTGSTASHQPDRTPDRLGPDRGGDGPRQQDGPHRQDGLAGHRREGHGPTPVGLSTGAVARRLGVAPTTLRSWDRRYGIGPAVRGDGRHRRWTAADVDLLERMCALTARGIPPAEAARLARTSAGGNGGSQGRAERQVPPPSAPFTGGVPRPRAPDAAVPIRTVRGLRNAAVRLDSPTLDQLLNDAVHTHGLVDGWQQAMAPALRAIGRSWADSGDAAGERYVEAEHLLSWHVSTALRRNATAKEVDDEQPVLLACLPGELHTLALEALTAALAEQGLPTRMFGAAVPLNALSEAVRRTGPRAVVLWSQTRPTADRSVVGRVRATACGVRGARTQPLVLAAGPGWARTAPSEGVHRPHDLAEALRIIAEADSG